MSILEQVSNLVVAAKALEDSSVVLVKNGRVLARKTGAGIRPLIEAVRETRDIAGATLGDRVIGVGVAKIAVLYGIAAAHAGLISEPARVLLESAGVAFTYDRIVPRILNRDMTGPCPIEAMAIGPIPPAELYSRLEAMLFPTPHLPSTRLPSPHLPC